MLLAIAAASQPGGFTTPQALISASGAVWSTKDGVTWTAHTVTTPASVNANARFGSNWITASTNGSIYYTDDTLGATWTAATVGNTTGEKNAFVVSGTSALAAGRLVTGGNNRYSAEQSTAVATWTTNNTSMTATDGFMLNAAATNGSNTWLVVGDNNSAQALSQTSLGGTWTTRTVGTTGNACAFGASLWVVGGASGALYTSPDLATWTSRTSGFGANAILGMDYGNNLFVAVGAAGNISTSTNGTTWTARTSGTANQLNGVKYCNPLNLWIAAGASSTILTSPDGITWTSRTAPTAGVGLAFIAVKP